VKKVALYLNHFKYAPVFEHIVNITEI